MILYTGAAANEARRPGGDSAGSGLWTDMTRHQGAGDTGFGERDGPARLPISNTPFRVKARHGIDTIATD
jgi:hypothetical protein